MTPRKDIGRWLCLSPNPSAFPPGPIVGIMRHAHSPLIKHEIIRKCGSFEVRREKVSPAKRL
jgi:hypothetical protein